MAIRKHGDGWIVDVRNGRQQRTRRHARTRQEAVEIEQALRARIRRSRLGLAIEYTLDEALARWLKSYAPAMRDQKTLSSARCLRPFIAGKTIREAPDVARTIRETYEAKPATVNRRLALLRRLCNLAYKEWDWIDEPIGTRIQLLTERNARHVYLTPPEIERLALHCRHLGAASAVLLAAYTGLRRGELLRLRPENYRDGWLVLDANTKSGRPRSVPVPGKVADIAESLPLPVADITLSRRFLAARVAAGMEYVRFHDLRHSYASLLAQAGESLRTIGDLLGHGSVTTTARYAHLASAHLRRAVASLERPPGDHLADQEGAERVAGTSQAIDLHKGRRGASD